MGKEFEKTIELIRRLEKAFPKAELISIKKGYDKFDHNKTISVSYSVYVTDQPYGLDIGSLPETEDYIDDLIKDTGV